jgi:hypothetical protein
MITWCRLWPPAWFELTPLHDPSGILKLGEVDDVWAEVGCDGGSPEVRAAAARSWAVRLLVRTETGKHVFVE